MIIFCYLRKNGEDDHVGDDPDYDVTDVQDKYIADNYVNGSNENDDGYNVGIDEDDEYVEDVVDDDDGGGCDWCYYWDCGCFFLSPCY